MFTTAHLMTVGAAAVANFIVGMIWYAPPVLGNKWMKLAKVKPDPNAMARTMFYGFLAAMVGACGLSYIMEMAAVGTVQEGALFGVTAWACIAVPVALQSIIYEMYPFELFFIHAGYNAIAYAAMGATLVWMG